MTVSTYSDVYQQASCQLPFAWTVAGWIPARGGNPLPQTANVGRGLNAAALPVVLQGKETRVDFTQLLDPLSAAIVIGGTLLATLLRCGWRDARAALAMLAQIPYRPFDSDRVRAELAAQVREIGEDGILRAEPHRFGDGEFDDLSEALVRHRSIKALFEEHERHRQRRQAIAQTAVRVLGEAAELAPVLGLAGTLFALGGYAPGVDGDYARSIGTAVVTTLYGLVLANFVFGPLAGAVERHARTEESERERLLDWLAAAIERTVPRHAGTGEDRVAA